MGKKLKKWGKCGIGLAAAVLLVMAFLSGRNMGKSEAAGLIQEKKEVTEDVLQQQIEEIGELNTAKYYYTNMGRYDNTLQIVGKNIPFTQKTFIISYDGTIKAGVDLKEVVVTLSGQTIQIAIPKAKILSHETDMGSVTVFDEKNSIFNGLSTEDVTHFLEEQNAGMEERAVGNGLLEEAQENTKDSLNALYQAVLTSGEYEDGYQLKFEMK